MYTVRVKQMPQKLMINTFTSAYINHLLFWKWYPHGLILLSNISGHLSTDMIRHNYSGLTLTINFVWVTKVLQFSRNHLIDIAAAPYKTSAILTNTALFKDLKCAINKLYISW